MAGTIRDYTTTHRGFETSLWYDKQVAILTLGKPGLSSDIHLNAADCRALAAMLTTAADAIEPAKEAA